MNTPTPEIQRTRDIPPITIMQAVDYETRSSWWIDRVGWEPAQALTARWLAWLVRRRFRRYTRSKTYRERGRNR